MKTISFAGMSVEQANSSSISYSSILKSAFGLLVVQEVPSLNVPLDEEAFNHEMFLLGQGLVCRFHGFWSSLIDLHKWILETWKPHLTNHLNIYPMAQGFFVVVSSNIDDKKSICDYGSQFWRSVSLFMQPWSPTFHPVTTSISIAPV